MREQRSSVIILTLSTPLDIDPSLKSRRCAAKCVLCDRPIIYQKYIISTPVIYRVLTDGRIYTRRRARWIKCAGMRDARCLMHAVSPLRYVEGVEN